MARRALPLPIRLCLVIVLCAPLIAFAGTGSDPFIRGDANSDGTVDIGDAIHTLAFLFSQGTAPVCMDAADANDDGTVDIGDAIYTLAFLFAGGSPPPPPFPLAGVDPTSGATDSLLCGDPCGPEELCNGLDDDCDGTVDEDPVDGTAYHPDDDGDGYGDGSSLPVIACVAPLGHVANGSDCDDDDPAVHPGATEICNGEDDDCDSMTDEDAVDATQWWPDLDGDTFGASAAPPVLACTAPAGHVADDTDCDDTDPLVHPGGTELCDGEDDDCDGTADDGAIDATSWYLDSDGDGFGDDSSTGTLACTAPAGHVADDTDCDDTDPLVHPGGTELCDGEDDDCDGTADDGAIDATSWYPDSDGDGFGDDSSTGTLACTAPPGHVGDPDDCDDGDSAIHPGAPEFCDGVDQDCDSVADDGAVDATAWFPDGDGDGFGTGVATLACSAPAGHVAASGDCDDTDPGAFPDAVETCDGIDQDCDGFTDEVSLSSMLEPARPPVAMSGRRGADALHMPVSIDLTDPGGNRTVFKSVCLPRLECTHEEVDLVLPGVGMDLVFQRRYRSRHDGASGAMGNQWEHSYEITYEVTAAGILLRSGDNREDLLVLQSDGVHYGAPGFLAHLDGVDIIVEFGNGVSWRLAPRGGGGGGGGGGHLVAISDDVFNQLFFSYDPAGQLSTITDTVGRVVTLSYDAAGRLVVLADGTGREWSYDYYLPGEPGGSPGDLRSVTRPPIVGTPTGNDFPLGRTTTYTYTSGHADDRLNHNLLTITDARGTVRVAYAYDLDPTSPTADALLAVARCIDQDCDDYGYVAQCESPSPANHGASLRVIVNDGRGVVTEHFFDSLHRCVMLHEYTGFADPALPTTQTTNRPGPSLRPTDPPYFETRYEWNADHRLTHVVHAAGNETQLLYEWDFDFNASLLARMNLRQVVRTPGTHVPAGPFPQLVESFEVAPGFGGFLGHEFRVLHTDARGGVTVTLRDALGNATQVQHPIPGVVEDFEYDARGRLTAHVRASHAPLGLPPARRRDEFTHHTAGPGAGQLAARVVDAAGVALTTSYDYDARGHLVHVVHPSGNDETFVRNSAGELVVHLSRAFGVLGTRYETRCWYDANGNRVRVDLQNRDADGAIVLANEFLTRIQEYDAFDRPSRLLEEEGIWFVLPGQLDGTGLPASEFVTTESVHDVAGRLLRSESGVATDGSQPDAVTVFEYDERDLLYRATRAPGTSDASTAQWSYGKNGEANTFDHFDFAVGLRQTTWVHDGYDRPITETDPMGNVRTFSHDENGNLTRLLLHGELADLPGSAANIRLSETEWSYDALDRRVSRHALRFDPATQLALSDGDNVNWNFGGTHVITGMIDDSGDTTTYEYDSAARLSRVTDPLGNQVELGYDPQSNVVTELHRDLSGVVPGLVQLREWTHAYDGLDRRISTTGPMGETRQWAHAWHGIGRTIDERGNVRRSIADSLGRVTRIEADLTASGSGGSPVIGTAVRQYGFDDNGRLVLEIDPNGHATTREYDPLDRLVRVLRADGSDETATWDARGQCVSEVDPNGTLRSYAYDLLARRVGVSVLAAPGVDPSATFASFVLDSEGRVRSAVNDDALVTRSYDSLGHPVAETVDGLTSSLATDDEGHTIAMAYPSGRQVDYASDPLGRVSLVSEAGDLLASIQYLGPGFVERHTTGDGVTTDHSYDASGRYILRSGTIGGGSFVVVHSYGWDLARNLTSHVDQSPGSTLVSKFHGYDSLSRLTATQASSPLLPPSLVNYQLDTAGNRVFVAGLPASGPYLLDPNLPEPADAQMHQYTQTPSDLRQYSAAGELSVVAPLIPGQPEAVYAHDGLGRLRSRQVGGLPPTEYDYDAFGRLVRISTGGQVTRLAHCWDAQCATHDALGTEVASYVFGPGAGGSGRIGGRWTGLLGTPEDFTFHTDSAGSVVLLTDHSGAVVERYDYGDHGQVTVRDALGAVIPASQVGNVHLFHGHRLDPSSGLYIVGDREFLEPETGRMVKHGRRLGWEPDAGISSAAFTSGWSPPGEYMGGNPTSARQRLLGLTTGSSFLGDNSLMRIIAGKGIGDGDLAARGDPDYTDSDDDGARLSMSWWGHCNGWAGCYTDSDDDGARLWTRVENFDPGCDDKVLSWWGHCNGWAAWDKGCDVWVYSTSGDTATHEVGHWMGMAPSPSFLGLNEKWCSHRDEPDSYATSARGVCHAVLCADGAHTSNCPRDCGTCPQLRAPRGGGLRFHSQMSASRSHTTTPGHKYIDEITLRGRSTLDNDTGAIDFVRWGAVDVPSDADIHLDLDDFESRSSLLIGPLP